MHNYESKFNYIWVRQQGMCLRYLDNTTRMKNKWYSKRSINKYISIIGLNVNFRITELHHRAHKTKWNIEKFPLFIHSILNLAGYCKYYHVKDGSSLKITDYKCERYESFLRKHPKIVKFVNGEFE